MTETKGRVGQMAEEIIEIKPAIKRFEAQRQHEEGARSLGKVLWIGFVAFASGLGYAAHEFIVWFWPPKH
jgi:hypothetical protein